MSRVLYCSNAYTLNAQIGSQASSEQTNENQKLKYNFDIEKLDIIVFTDANCVLNKAENTLVCKCAIDEKIKDEKRTDKFCAETQDETAKSLCRWEKVSGDAELQIKDAIKKTGLKLVRICRTWI